MTASIIFLRYFFLNNTNMLRSEYVGAATIDAPYRLFELDHVNILNSHQSALI